MILKTTVQQYFLIILLNHFLLFLTEGQIDYALSLRVGFSLHLLLGLFSFFHVTYSYRKRTKHFLISVSVSKVDYREKVEIIFIATKTP